MPVDGLEDAPDWKLLAVENVFDERGLDIIGVSVLRKSVYATGGVIGVFMASSCLISSNLAENKGLSWNSDGKTSALEVSRGASVGFVGEEGMLTEYRSR